MTDAIDDDPYLWLEEIVDPAALAWVRDRNAETVAALTGSPRFAALRDEIRWVLDNEDRIPLVFWHGGHLYNLWKDETHPRGLWRRATLDEYRKHEPDWQLLIDLDELAAAEGESWVWQDVEMLRPDGDRCLVSLSPGGSDASVVREFDLVRAQFVADGFGLPAAKSRVGWIDEDRIYVGTDFGPGSLTSSGYPRLIKEWRRGTPLAHAPVVFEGQADDVSVFARHDPTPGFSRDIVGRSIDFFRRKRYLRTGDGTLLPIEVPDDADLDTHREWLLVRLRSAWTAGGVEYPAGALLAARFDDFLGGDRTMTALFEPDPVTSLSYHSWTRDHLILSLLCDVRSRQEVLTPGPDGWQRGPLVAADRLPEYVHTEVLDTDPDRSDEFLLLSSGYVQPATLRYGTVGGEVDTLRQEPAFFDAEDVEVRQYFAASADGTRIPYFVVGSAASGGPTLLTGYGGFEVSRVPYYNGIVGRAWLSRGGRYVVANIRGGGEYGPRWHRAAMRENRPRAYEDFAAVATDLVRRGVTSRERLGIDGGSNGGLLVGVMLTRYPELFGAVVCQVPLLDMRRYHRMLAGASWMAEYGDPDDPADWAYLREFSPYHNVHSGRPYPPALFVTSTRDDRVHPGHARKMMARLREHGYDVSYYENIEGGHGAAADNAQLAFKSALVMEFLWRRLAPGRDRPETALPDPPAAPGES
jgi:prolyl oligopeptidase